MLELKPTDFLVIQKHFVDFQKKSGCLEMPPESAQYLGIYTTNTLIGYFVVQGYDSVEVEVNQGYLLPKYRHQDISKDCMAVLETLCKAAGYKRMLLGTHNRFRSYLKFAKSLGYTPQHLTFVKEI